MQNDISIKYTGNLVRVKVLKKQANIVEPMKNNKKKTMLLC